jgi:NADH:ubiquinone oxidoreductase subunit 6 (subunit J)
VSAVFFFLAAIGALAGAIGVVSLRDPFYSVLALAFHLVSLAALFLLLRAEFVAAAQVVVYAGAVMVLYVFVVAYVGGGQALPSAGALRFFAPLFAIALAVELCIAMLGTGLKGVKHDGAPYVRGFGTPQHIGTLLLTKFLFPFEAASILLLIAAVGAVVLARRRAGLEDTPAPEAPDRIDITTAQPGYVGTMAEAAGIRPGGGDPPLQPDVETVGGSAQVDRGGW